MQLAPRQVERFYGIWDPLLQFVNKKRQLMDARLLNDVTNVSGAAAVRDVLWSDDNLLAQFVRDNPAGLDEIDLAVARSWSARVAGTFFVVKNLQKYSILAGDESHDDQLPKMYGVLGLSRPIADNLVCALPCMVKGVLLPFDGKIIYDSIFISYPVRLGSNIRTRLNREYQEAKKRGAIIETLEPPQRDIDPAENVIKTIILDTPPSGNKKKRMHIVT